MKKIRVSMPNDTAFDLTVSPENWDDEIAWLEFMDATWTLI